MASKDTAYAVGFAALAVIALGWVVRRTIVSDAKNIGAAINPVSDENIFNRGFNALLEPFIGEGETLGSKLYEWTHETPQLNGSRQGANPTPKNGNTLGPAKPYKDDGFRFYDKSTW